MKKLRCACCGGEMDYPGSMDAPIRCPFCQTQYAPETAKKMLVELSGPVRIDGTVQVEGIDNANALAHRAEVFLSLGERKRADDIFESLRSQFPDDYRGWWGETRMMDWQQFFLSEQGDMPECCRRALYFAPPDKQQEISRFHQQQVAAIKPQVDSFLEHRRQELAPLENQLRQLTGQKQQMENQSQQMQDQLQQLIRYSRGEKETWDALGYVLLALIGSLVLWYFLSVPIFVLTTWISAGFTAFFLYRVIRILQWRKLEDQRNNLLNQIQQVAHQCNLVNEQIKTIRERPMPPVASA